MVGNSAENIAKAAARKISELGGTAYYVGGFVRDKLMGAESKDIDIEVHGIEPAVLERILSDFGEVMKRGASFGVYSIKGLDIDFALPRTEVRTGGRHTDFDVTVDSSLGAEKAAGRRDFTINAIMENVLTGEITDSRSGRDDLQNRLIRHVDDSTFAEDALRVLRAAQFAARFGFEIAEETVELCGRIDLSELSKERVFAEMEKALLKADRPSVFFERLRDMGQLSVWFPEAEALIGTKQNEIHHREGDVWAHTMFVLDEAAKLRERAEQPLAFMLSALCHDFGKPAVTFTDEKGITHSYRHETEGIPIAGAFIGRLTSNKTLKRYVLNMTELHMQPNILAGCKAKVKSTNKMFDKSVSPWDLILLSECDCRGKIPSGECGTAFLTERLGIYREMMKRPHVTGRDLICAGMPPGANFSDTLAYAHKLRLAGVDKSCALRMTLAYARKKGFI
ncbi:MAG: hypothetical protein NC395_07710 [Prevotella sp.]|nr:hypothetical protein [Prevotella sp.]